MRSSCWRPTRRSSSSLRAFALASSATEAEVPSTGAAELARAAPGGSLVAIFRLSPFLGPRRRFKPAAPWRRHAQRHSYNSFLAIPNSSKPCQGLAKLSNVVGWALADHLQASLPLEALDKAIVSRGGSLKDVIHHSDRGVQYACRDYALRLSQIGAHASMSRPGTPQDNAKAESFMHTLKAEEVDGKAYRSCEDAESKIGAFIDHVYNARRLHSSIGYKPPIEFEDEFRQAQKREANQPMPVSQNSSCLSRRAQSSVLMTRDGDLNRR